MARRLGRIAADAELSFRVDLNVGLRTQRAWLVIAATPDQTRLYGETTCWYVSRWSYERRRRLIPSQSRRKHDDEVASFDFAEFDCVV